MKRVLSTYFNGYANLSARTNGRICKIFEC